MSRHDHPLPLPAGETGPLPVRVRGAATYTAAQVAELFGCSSWSVYQLVAREQFPVAPIRLGRKLVWSRSAVDAALGIDRDDRESASA